MGNPRPWVPIIFTEIAVNNWSNRKSRNNENIQTRSYLPTVFRCPIFSLVIFDNVRGETPLGYWFSLECFISMTITSRWSGMGSNRWPLYQVFDITRIFIWSRRRYNKFYWMCYCKGSEVSVIDLMFGFSTHQNSPDFGFQVQNLYVGKPLCMLTREARASFLWFFPHPLIRNPRIWYWSISQYLILYLFR